MSRAEKLYSKFLALREILLELGADLTPEEIFSLLIDVAFFKVGDCLQVEDHIKEKIRELGESVPAKVPLERIFVIPEGDYHLIEEISRRTGIDSKKVLLKAFKIGLGEILRWEL